MACPNWTNADICEDKFVLVSFPKNQLLTVLLLWREDKESHFAVPNYVQNWAFFCGTTIAPGKGKETSAKEQMVKSACPTPRRSAVWYDVLAYLADHPDAQDTVEGIVEWWLLERRIKRITSQTKVALTQLVAEGLVIARTDRTGRVYYRVNRQKLRKIRQLLQE